MEMDSSLLLAVIVAVSILAVILLLDFGSNQRSKYILQHLKSSNDSFSLEDELNDAEMEEVSNKSLITKLVVNLRAQLRASKITMSLGPWLSIGAVVFVGLVVTFTFFANIPIIVSMIFAGIFVVFGHITIIKRRQRKLAKQFSDEFPNALGTIASSIRAGLNFDQGLEAVANQSKGELGDQLRHALRDIELGSSPEDALKGVALRTGNKDIDWLIDALGISRETGSSISQVLDTVANSIHERAQLKREIQSLTAEGMLSAYVVVALPFLIFLFLLITQPSYVSVFWTNPLGLAIAGGALALIGVGWLWLKTIVKIKGP